MVGKHLLGVFALYLVCGVLSAKPTTPDFNKIYKKFQEQCYSDPDNYITDTDIVKCNVTFEGSCWPETPAGTIVVQRCPFLFFRPENNISRRCDENGHWEKMNAKLCHPLNEKEATDVGNRVDNNSSVVKTQSISGLLLVYVVFNWIALTFMVPSLILICVFIGRQNDRFNIHKNLILSYVLRIVTFFAYHYAGVSTTTTACNVLWVLNRYFAVSEVTWMLVEAIFLLRMIVYPLDNQSYFTFYFIIGWGVSGVLTFCVYLPFVQFVIARQFESCWINHSDTVFMLVLYVPMTIMLLINLAIMVFVVYTTVRKLKDSHTPQLVIAKKAAKAAIVLLPTLGVIYLIIFYIPPGNTGYDYFVRIIYPMQGILVCIFLVFLSSDVQNAVRGRWRTFRHTADPGPYNVQPERNEGNGRSGDNREGAHHRRPAGNGPLEEFSSNRNSNENNASTGATNSSSSSAVQETSINTTRSSRVTLRSAGQRHSEASLLSRSSDLLKRRSSKVEPGTPQPVRIDVGCHGNRDSPATVFVHSSGDGKPIPAKHAWGQPEVPEKDTTSSNESLPNISALFREPTGTSNKGYLSHSATDLKEMNARTINRSAASLGGTDSLPQLPQGRAFLMDPMKTSTQGTESDLGGTKAKQAINRSATSLKSMDSYEAQQLLLDETLFMDKTDDSARETEREASGLKEEINKSVTSVRSIDSGDPQELTHAEAPTEALQKDNSSLHRPLSRQLSLVEEKTEQDERERDETGECEQLPYSAEWLLGDNETELGASGEDLSGAAGYSEMSAPPSRGRDDSRSPDARAPTVWARIRAKNKERRKRRISAQPIETHEVPLETIHRRHSEVFKEPDEYRAAWIRRIMGRQAFEDNDESSA